MFTIKNNSLNLTVIGDVLSDIIILPSLTDDIGIGTIIAVNSGIGICFDLRYDIPIKENCVLVDSIELTAANPNKAQYVLEKIAIALGEHDSEKFVSDGLIQYQSDKYCKCVHLERFVDAKALEELVADDTFADCVNEITLVFEMNDLIKREIRELNGKRGTEISSLKFRIADGILNVLGKEKYQSEYESLAGRLHHIMVHTDALIIVEELYFFNPMQLALVKRYLNVFPSVAFNISSDLLSEKFEDVTDEEVIRTKYFGVLERGRISCNGVKALYNAAGTYPVMKSDSFMGIFSYAGTMGFENDNSRLFKILVAASLGSIADKLIDFYSVDLSDVKNALRKTADSGKTRLFHVPESSSLTSERLTEYFESDRPLLATNGGITTKSHGKLRFPESCQLARNAYQFLNCTINYSYLSDEEKKILKIALMQKSDAYALLNGEIILNRWLYSKSVENARKNGDYSGELVARLLDTTMGC